MKRAGLLAFLVITPSIAQQAVLLDFSGSMSGFAGSHQTRSTGLLQRLGSTLVSSGPVQFFSISAPEHHPSLTPLTMNDAARRFANPQAFGGFSPLRWAISEAVNRRNAKDIVMFTDGMEDDARVEDFANSFVQYAKDGWSMGVAAMILPFDGTYYAEMKFPFPEFRSKIESAVRAEDAGSKIEPATCSSSQTATCYHYIGHRPLLVFLLSKTGSLDRLFGSLEQAASELLLQPPSEVVLFPAASLNAEVHPVLSPASREVIRAPRSMVSGNAEFECLRASDSPVDVTLAISARHSARMEATVSAPIEVRLKSTKPKWVRTVATKLITQPDGAVRHDASFVCVAPSIIDSMGNASTILGATLRLEYKLANVPRTSGWWLDMSAPNSWQYPHRVYHLREFVAGLQSLAVSGQTSKLLEIEISLRSRR